MYNPAGAVRNVAERDVRDAARSRLAACQFGLGSDCPLPAEDTDKVLGDEMVREWDPLTDGVCNMHAVGDRLEKRAHPLVLRDAIAASHQARHSGAPRCFGAPRSDGKRQLQGALAVEWSSDRSAVVELSSVLSS